MNTIRVGIDVSSKTFDVCLATHGGLLHWKLSNDAAGHASLLERLAQRGSRFEVVMEATGVYHLHLACTLAEQHGVQVMVLNPHVFHAFAKSIAPRGKSDKKDAKTLLTYLERMPFEPWSPVAEELMELRSLMRRAEQLTKDIQRESNRLHALERDPFVHELVLEQCKGRITSDKEMLAELYEVASQLVRESEVADLREDVELLVTIPGVGEKTALVLASEVCSLSKQMSAKQWVAYMGLDPCECSSGTSVHRRGRISKRGNRFVRRALFMTAMTASQFCEPVGAFKTELEERGKSKKQALVAIMRKLMHCIWGMLRHKQPFDPSRFRGPSRRLSVNT